MLVRPPGTAVAVNVAPFTPVGTARAVFGASTWVFGLEDTPVGLSDSGAGGSDMLILKKLEL